MEYRDCLICKKKKATKSNSHLIPSFMIAKMFSYDGSGKRGKGVMFTMSPCEDKIYVGAIPDTKIEELFDPNKLTDERINEELKNNTLSKDFIFCPTCEANLSKYLESPYANYFSKGKSLNIDISYFFWVSIIWRMSISRQFEFSLPNNIEQSLGDCLYEYMDAVIKGQDVVPIIEKCNFSYRLLRCQSCKNWLSFFWGRYEEEEGIITYIFGDVIICMKFDNTTLPEDFSFFGFEETIKSAPVNNGTIKEKYIELDYVEFGEGMTRITKEISFKRLLNEIEKANIIWQKIGLSGSIPNEISKVFIDKLYSQNSKQGDRKTDERYMQIFKETLKSFGYLLSN